MRYPMRGDVGEPGPVLEGAHVVDWDAGARGGGDGPELPEGVVEGEEAEPGFVGGDDGVGKGGGGGGAEGAHVEGLFGVGDAGGC